MPCPPLFKDKEVPPAFFAPFVLSFNLSLGFVGELPEVGGVS